MILADNKTDSLLIYSDWLEDNDQLALAIEIREELQELNIQHFHDASGCHTVGTPEQYFTGIDLMVDWYGGNDLVGTQSGDAYIIDDILGVVGNYLTFGLVGTGDMTWGDGENDYLDGSVGSG